MPIECKNESNLFRTLVNENLTKMTTLNIIIKAVETLKNFQEQESADSDFGARYYFEYLF